MRPFHIPTDRAELTRLNERVYVALIGTQMVILAAVMFATGALASAQTVTAWWWAGIAVAAVAVAAHAGLAAWLTRLRRALKDPVVGLEDCPGCVLDDGGVSVSLTVPAQSTLTHGGALWVHAHGTERDRYTAAATACATAAEHFAALAKVA